MKRSISSIVVDETAEGLEKLMHKEKDPRRRERIHMLYLIRSGLAATLLVVASVLGRHRTTITRWLQAYENGDLQTLINRKRQPKQTDVLPPNVFGQFKLKLSSPEGFASYGEIRHWLKQEHQIHLSDDQIYRLLKRLKASPKVARPRHRKQNRKALNDFKEHFPKIVKHAIKAFKKTPEYRKNPKPIHVWFQDESRFGLFTIKRRRITSQGVKPIGPMQNKFKSCYLYGLVEPKTGDHFFLELPYFDTDGFQVFIDEFHQENQDAYHIMCMDGAGVHRSESLNIPANIRLIKLPAYSPELNPIERVWQEIKSEIAWENFDTLDDLIDYVCNIICTLTKDQIKNLTAYPYIKSCFRTIAPVPG